MEKTKKVTSVILAIILLLSTLSCVPFSAFANSNTFYLSDGKAYCYYDILDDGTAEITNYYGNLSNLVIPSKVDSYTVTSIGHSAFGYNNFTSITLPNSVTNIGIFAFCGCEELTSITIPNSVKSIGDQAFVNCKKLKTITLPNSLKNIGEYVFWNCSSLTEITIPNGITSISNSLFTGCSSLKTVTIPNSVKRIESGAFGSCESLTNISIPNSVMSIGDDAFENCKSLKSVIIPNSVTSIGLYAFNGCKGLTSVTIPNSVKSIGIAAFGNCTSLKTVTIPNSVTSIGAYMFSNCSSLASVTIPSSITNIGGEAFMDCKALKDVYYTGSKSQWNKVSIGVLNDPLTNAIMHYGILDAPKLSSVVNTTTGVKISWGKVTGAEKYRIFYKTGNGKWTKLTDTTSTSYTWKNAKSGTKYSFTVRCISKDGKSYTSAYDTKGKSITYVAAPKLSSVTNTSTGVKISWGKVKGAEKYRIFYKTGNGKWKKLTDTTSTSYTWKKAKSGTKYSFTVRCISKDGKSYTSAYDTKGKSITFVSAPKISKLSKTSSGIKISWDKVNGAAKYRIFYKTANGKWKKLTDTTSTSYTWKGGKKGTDYSFTVRCISKDGKTYTSAYDTKGKSIKR